MATAFYILVGFLLLWATAGILSLSIAKSSMAKDHYNICDQEDLWSTSKGKELLNDMKEARVIVTLGGFYSLYMTFKCMKEDQIPISLFWRHPDNT